VWAASQKLIQFGREAVTEAAKARFKANFGGPFCSRCEGLKAGPGIAATCFQVQQCYFDNFKEDPSPKQELVVRRLLGD